MEKQEHYYSGHTIGDKTFYHSGGPFVLAADAREFQKFACPSVPDGFKLAVLCLTVTKNTAGKSEYKVEVV